jgi:L-fucose mutarotase
MLKGIPAILSPDLMRTLMLMGHGDEIVLADGHFPAASLGPTVIRADGLMIPQLLTAILQFLPLDSFVERPAAVMQPVHAQAAEPPCWNEYRRLIATAEGRTWELETVERFAFYERARQAFAIVATSDTATYANLILKKGLAGVASAGS